MFEFMANCGCSPGRGAYDCALHAARQVYAARCTCRDFFGAADPACAVFVPGATFGLNAALQGLLLPGDHVLVSSLEHNAVMRPLQALEKQRGIEVSVVEESPVDAVGVRSWEEAMRPNTRMIAASHASNVIGICRDLSVLGDLAVEHGLWFVVDAAQTAGLYDINVSTVHIDALAFSGHKALMGPPGIGGLIVSPRAGTAMAPLVYGGTGSQSETESQPEFLPDRLESGTMNTPGIVGLAAGIDYVSAISPTRIRQHIHSLSHRFIAGLEQIPGIASIQSGLTPTAVVSVVPQVLGPSELAYELDAQYGVMVRSGLHCAPAAHRFLGTFPAGTVRFSFGWFNTDSDVDYTLEALAALASSLPGE